MDVQSNRSKTSGKGILRTPMDQSSHCHFNDRIYPDKKSQFDRPSDYDRDYSQYKRVKTSHNY